MNIQQNISLKPYNTFHIDVKAKEFATFSTITELQKLLNYKQQAANNKLILGGGSNILFTKNVDDLVLKNELKGIEIVREDKHHVYVKAAAGENWHRLVLYCIEHHLAGLENLSLIPGSVGASPMQNIGAYGIEIKDVFENLEALHKADGTVHLFSNNDCKFGYRDSIFKTKYKNEFVILSVVFRLNKEPKFNTSYGAIEQELESMQVKELSIRAIAQAVINIRTSKLPDPLVIGNAGSFFKNPTVSLYKYQELERTNAGMPHYKINEDAVKIPAAWLIEQCGWKGFREGDAGVHIKQALVLVNYGNASGEEIYNLSSKIIKSVEEKFGITLEREVNIV